jgi:hypothetical protein
MRLDIQHWPRLVFTETGLAALRTMMRERRLADPVKVHPPPICRTDNHNRYLNHSHWDQLNSPIGSRATVVLAMPDAQSPAGTGRASR